MLRINVIKSRVNEKSAYEREQRILQTVADEGQWAQGGVGLFKEIEQFLRDTAPPAYKFTIEHAVAARGIAIFLKGCVTLGPKVGNHHLIQITQRNPAVAVFGWALIVLALSGTYDVYKTRHEAKTFPADERPTLRKLAFWAIDRFALIVGVTPLLPLTRGWLTPTLIAWMLARVTAPQFNFAAESPEARRNMAYVTTALLAGLTGLTGAFSGFGWSYIWTLVGTLFSALEATDVTLKTSRLGGPRA